MPSKIKARIYYEDFTDNVTLSKEHSHYLITVLRSQIGDHVHLFNPRQGEVLFEIGLAHPKKTVLNKISEIKPATKDSDQLWLAFAPIKKNRIMFLAEKLSEIGVHQAFPIITEYTDKQKINDERFIANMIEAAEQCERLSVPTLNEPQKLDEFLSNFPKDRALIICAEKYATASLYNIIKDNRFDKVAFLIGPEGGFSDSEFERLKTHPQAHLVSLGANILRAETASIAALSCWQMICGEW